MHMPSESKKGELLCSWKKGKTLFSLKSRLEECWGLPDVLMSINLKIASLLCIWQLCFWSLHRSLFVSVLWTPGHFAFVLSLLKILQLNGDEYSKGSFKGSLMLILQNNAKSEAMGSRDLWMSSDKECLVVQMYRSLFYSYHARWHQNMFPSKWKLHWNDMSSLRFQSGFTMLA